MMADMQMDGRIITQPFRPRARVLQLLGDELIGSPRLAVFELVKNAYDADATKAVVCLDLTRPDGPMITITDDGEGMTLEVLRSVWLVPGDEHRRRQLQNYERSPRHHRLPLGEKGIGRFASHKLGNRITLTTRARDSDECVVDIDWNVLIEKPFLDEAPVTILVREPQVFTGERTGTRIEVRELRPPEWRRREVRSLCTQITSICSPFERPGEFRAELQVPGREGWIEDLPDFNAILRRAMWKFQFRLEKDSLDWSYEFRPAAGFNIKPRKVTKTGDRLQLPPVANGREDQGVVADAGTTHGIGPVSGEFYVFDRDREVLRQLGNTRTITDYLDKNGGIRVYRDGVRVYNYGEQGDDWLGLDLRRVNMPTLRISRNIILGAVHLSRADSDGLREMTNREGFIENDACARLHQIVLGAVGTLEAERHKDKNRIRKVTQQPNERLASRIEKPIQELRQALARHGAAEQFEPYVAKIEYDYRDMQDTLLTAGMSGLSLAVVFHEVEHGVRALRRVIVEGRNLEEAARQAQELMRVLDGFSALLRRDSIRLHDARRLIAAAKQFNLLRFRHHRVRLDSPVLEANQGFKSPCALGLVLGAMNNLIDNSLYWLRVRWPERPTDSIRSSRRLLIDASRELEGGPAIIFADNGVGFQDDPEHLTRPFFTRKPKGMGLGLYYANLAMELNGGRLAFPRAGEVDVSSDYDGALVAMIFKEAK